MGSRWWTANLSTEVEQGGGVMAVYVSGLPVVTARAHGQSWPVQRTWRNRFPRVLVESVMTVSFGRADRYCTPPAGEPFIVGGQPYATPEEFIDSFLDEVRAGLLKHLADTGQSSGEVAAKAL